MPIYSSNGLAYYISYMFTLIPQQRDSDYKAHASQWANQLTRERDVVRASVLVETHDNSVVNKAPAERNPVDLRIRRLSMRSGAIRSVLLLPILFVIFVVGFGGYFDLAAGGTLGGLGAAPRDGDAWWLLPIDLFFVAAWLGLDIWAGVKRYRKRRSQLTGQDVR